MAIKYIIVTPVRDEAEHIRHTLESVCKQSITPRQWIIVDDGSTDGTPEIVEDFTRRYDWIKLMRRKNRGFRKNGGGVIEAFYDGYAAIAACDFDFIVKLDGDLSFDQCYFENCFNHFKNDPKLGVGGGVIVNIDKAQPEKETHPRFHVRGATKIYRADCWKDIGYLLKAPGWDTLDEVKANMKGWKTESFLELVLYQHKSTGSADGLWKNWTKNGLANYIAGYHPLFMFVKCIKRIVQKPYFIAAAGLFTGFCSGYINKVDKVEEPELIRFLRKQQLRKLFLRKSIWS